jgi:hypothetical protein
MTYNELLEVADVAFDEYLPKMNGKTRRAFLDALFTELEDLGVLTVDDEVPEPLSQDNDEDDLY